MLKEKIKLYFKFSRPFTLIAPALGMLSGGLTAWGAFPKFSSSWQLSVGGILLNIVLGIIMAASLNAASNGLNQIFDLELDKINKPKRLLPQGKITLKEAWGISLFFYFFSLLLSLSINWQCFILVVIAALMTYAYSAPPLRTKRWGIVANFTIAIPRGLLLKVAGWSTVKTIFSFEPWLIGGIFGLFLLGATTTKDYADIKGDQANHCLTLPIKYGIKKSAYIISPFFILPFFLMPLGARLGYLTGNQIILSLAGIFLTIWGGYVAYLMITKPEQLKGENHPSWKQMYLMMFFLQIIFAMAYLI